MNNFCAAKSRIISKNWPQSLNFLKFSRKKLVRPTNANLYAYAANNPVHYTDPDGNSILSGLAKTIIGSAQSAIGTAGALLCGAGATALVADDATLIGVLDDPLALALAAGATASSLYAASGLKLASDGLNETAEGVSEVANNLIQKLQHLQFLQIHYHRMIIIMIQISLQKMLRK